MNQLNVIFISPMVLRSRLFMKSRRCGSPDGNKLKATRSRKEKDQRNDPPQGALPRHGHKYGAKERPLSEMGTKEGPAHTAATLPPTHARRLLCFPPSLHHSWPTHASPLLLPFVVQCLLLSSLLPVVHLLHPHDHCSTRKRPLLTYT